MELSVTIPVGAAAITLTADNSKDIDALLAAAVDRIEVIASLAAQAATAAANNGLTAAAPVAASAAVETPAAGPIAEPDPVVRPGGAPRPAGPNPGCVHGARKWVSGAKNGKSYAFWSCESEQDTCTHVYP